MGGGPSSKTMATQQQLTTGQQQIAQTEQAQSQEQYQQYLALTAPAIAKYSTLTGIPLPPGISAPIQYGTMGQAATAAAAPEIGMIAQGYEAARQNISNTIPPGAVRDQALANLELQKYTGTASALAKEVQQAPDVLANIGAGTGAFSLQQLGAALSGYGGASSTNQALAQMQNQGKANTIGALQGIGGMVGEAAGGFLGGPAFAGLIGQGARAAVPSIPAFATPAFTPQSGGYPIPGSSIYQA